MSRSCPVADFCHTPAPFPILYKKNVSSSVIGKFQLNRNSPSRSRKRISHEHPFPNSKYHRLLCLGTPMLLLLVGTGVVLCIRTRFLPWRKLPFALKSTLQRSARTVDASGGRAGGISPFSALMTSLAATIGTGNIIGVATALVLGGRAHSYGCGSLPLSVLPLNSVNVCSQ